MEDLAVLELFSLPTRRASRGAKRGIPSLLPPPGPLGGGLRAGRRASRGAKRGIPSLLPVLLAVGCGRGAALCAAKETILPGMGQGKGSHHQQFFSQAMRQWVRAMAAQACELTTRRRRSRWTARARRRLSTPKPRKPRKGICEASFERPCPGDSPPNPDTQTEKPRKPRGEVCEVFQTSSLLKHFQLNCMVFNYTDWASRGFHLEAFFKQPPSTNGELTLPPWSHSLPF